MALNRAFSASELSAAGAIQFGAACIAIAGCASLAGCLPQRKNDTFRLTSALALVFEVGPQVLRVCASMAPAQHSVVLHECNCQLVAVADVLRQAVPQPEAAAAFAKTAGRPQAVLPWLLAISRALLATPPEANDGECVRCHCACFGPSVV